MTEPIDSGATDIGAGGSDDLDLTPRSTPEDVAGPASRRRVVPSLLVLAVIAALGFVLFQTLGDTALFFYNADEAIERRTELEEQRFRLQGTPFGAPTSIEVERAGGVEAAVVFPVRFEGATIDVVHVGDPAALFQPNVPVVLEGQWQRGLPVGVEQVTDGANDGWHFASTEMIVKHDNEYRNDNSGRLSDAERGGFVPEP